MDHVPFSSLCSLFSCAEAAGNSEVPLETVPSQHDRAVLDRGSVTEAEIRRERGGRRKNRMQVVLSVPRPGFSSRPPASPLGPRIHPRNRRPASPRSVCKSLNTFPTSSSPLHLSFSRSLARSLSRHNDVLFATHPRFHDEFTPRIFRSNLDRGRRGGRGRISLVFMRCKTYYFFSIIIFRWKI